MSEDMLLKTGFGDKTRCTGESGEGVGVREQDGERKGERAVRSRLASL